METKDIVVALVKRGIGVPGMSLNDPKIYNAWCVLDSLGNLKACIEFTAQQWAGDLYQKSLNSFMCVIGAGTWIRAQTEDNITVAAYESIAHDTDWDFYSTTCGNLWTWVNQTAVDVSSTFAQSVISCANSAASTTCSAIAEMIGQAQGVTEVCANSTAFQIANQTGYQLGYKTGVIDGFMQAVQQLGPDGVANAVSATTKNAVLIGAAVTVTTAAATALVSFWAGKRHERNQALRNSNATALQEMRETQSSEMSEHSVEGSVDLLTPQPKR